MRPIYKIALDGEDITSNFNDRLLTMTVVEQSEAEADKLTIELDDRDGVLEVPPTGRALEVFLGYKETGVTSLGSYVIDTVRLQQKPSTMTLSGSSANLSKDGLKQHRTANYEGKTLTDIAGEIAARNGLKLSVDPTIGASMFAMLHQIDESDMNLLRRLGRDHDALFKIAAGTLILAKRGARRDLAFTLTPQDVKPGSVVVTYRDRPDFDSSTAYYWDPATAERKPVSSSGATAGGGTFAIKHTMLDQDKAKAAADARQAELDRAKVEARAELALGDPSVTADGVMTLSGFRTAVDGSYGVVSVTHSYDSNGYTTAIVAECGGA